ncbi:MAG: hypothetical protein F6K22_31420 [Okeania sp. SIO2F4]|uniref:hypothetical protein n=1 Tax=Okeania sp. SIO2F4 TaxID=2607790 RepID=UPI0014291D6F|nr:hypothetical protein [Okeania sp. SIO2F4]MDJ0516348.1 hypothetical protein [Trichodesmium sp. MO_231.B1]NES06929.1 hypothetical protein [Okeania sp. SIO2F4]
MKKSHSKTKQQSTKVNETQSNKTDKSWIELQEHEMEDIVGGLTDLGGAPWIDPGGAQN